MKRKAINFDCANCGHNPVWIDTDAPGIMCFDSDQLTCPECGASGWVSVDEGEATPEWDEFMPGMTIFPVANELDNQKLLIEKKDFANN